MSLLSRSALEGDFGKLSAPFCLAHQKINIISDILIAHVKSYSTSLLNKLDRLHIYVEPNFPT